MKRVFIVLLCTFFSFTMLFALDSSTTGNVSLNVAIDSVAIGFVGSVEDARNATSSTSGTNHVVSLTPNGNLSVILATSNLYSLLSTDNFKLVFRHDGVRQILHGMIIEMSPVGLKFIMPPEEASIEVGHIIKNASMAISSYKISFAE